MNENTETQKGHPFGWPFHWFDAWQFPTLTWGDPTLPSALRRFTSEFGMGSGGTTALKPPGKFCCQKRIFYTDTALAALVKLSHILLYAPSLTSLAALPQRKIFRSRKSVINAENLLSNPPKHLRRCKVKPHGSLVPVSSTHRCAYTPGLSTSSSLTFL